MDCIVFVPGIMGSRLSTPEGEEVWPPTVLETQTGYRRRDKLERPDLVVTDVVRKVWCVGIYQPLLDQFADIGYTETGTQKRLVLFPYDWRQDLETTADALADRIAALVAGGATRVTIVAHSMGGLVTRLMLEGGRNAAAPWLDTVRMFIALAVPHRGAPLALARVLGLDSALGISPEDFRRFANNPAYPSGYQLLPAPGDAAVWDAAVRTLPPLDIYDPAVATRLGLHPGLLARARFVHDTLANGTPPAHVRYVAFAATGHTTVTRVNLLGSGAKPTSTDDAGDGTVPLWSALPAAVQRQLVPGEHAGFFGGTAFKAVFYRLLGADFPVPPLAVAARAVELSVGRLVFPASEPVDLLLALLVPTGRISGEIGIARTENPDDAFVDLGRPIPVDYTGPTVDSLKLVLPPIGRPGQYRITFRGQPGNAAPVHFALHE